MVKFDKMIGSGKPVFYYDLIKRFGENEDQFNLYAHYKIEYDRLHFENIDGKFVSKFNISFAVFRDGEDIPFRQKFVDKVIEADKFSDTENQKLYDFGEFNVALPVGEYNVELKIESRRGVQYYKKVEDISFFYLAENGVTELTLYKSDGDYFDLNNAIPVINNRIDEDTKNLGVYFEVLAPEGENYTIEYSLQNHDKVEIFKDQKEGISKGRINKEVITINLENSKIGNYFLKVNVKSDNYNFERYTPLTIRWRDDTAEISDLDEAIRNMIYLFDSPDSLNTVLHFGEDKKREWFNQFWDRFKRSGKNNIMDEYYRRVNFTNNNFNAGMKAGWKSDRGQVYIIYGEPDEIQRHEFVKSMRPYEVWVYYNRGTHFVFDLVAGDYKLRRE